MIIVYTGNGKGKTSACVGQALRARGQNFHVAFAQFMKSHGVAGEQRLLAEMLGDAYFCNGRGFYRGRAEEFAAHRAVVQETDGKFSVVCSIGDMGSDVFRMELAMPDKLTAEMIKNNFIAHGSDIFPKLLNALTQPGSEDDRPPAGLM